jgi:membrane protease YdiL (CAAX protease family)
MLALISIGMLVSLVANFSTSIMKYIFNKLGIYYSAPDFCMGNTPLSIIISIISISIIPAIFEELVFRGFILNKFKKFGSPFAIFLSAILFGLFHGNLVQIPFAFILGLYLGFLVIETNSLWPSILLHFFNNFYAVIISTIQENCPNKIYILASIFFLTLFTIFSLISLKYILKLRPNFPSINNQEALPFKNSIKESLLAPGMIIFNVIMFINIACTFA